VGGSELAATLGEMACHSGAISLLVALYLILVPCVWGAVVKRSHVVKIKPISIGKGRGDSRPLFGGGDIVENDKLEPQSAACQEPFPAPERGARVCPAMCPFMQYDPHKICHWKCITEDQCLNSPNMPSSVADPVKKICTICTVAGCERCAINAQECLVCKDGFDLDKGTGKCLPSCRWIWRGVYALVGLLVLAGVAWVVELYFRPVVNPDALDSALIHRSHSKVRNEGDNHQLYPLTTNLCSEIIPSGGIGILLHSRFENLALCWAIFVAIVMGSVAMVHSRMRVADLMGIMPFHEEIFDKCQSLTIEDQQQLELMRVHFLYATEFVYVFSFVGALAFSASQRRKFAATEATTPSMGDFALYCKGFPKDGWGPEEPEPGVPGLEDEYTKFFRNSGWGEDVLGVSIVWDVADKQDEVSDILVDTIARMDTDRRHEGPLEVRPNSRGSCSCLAAIEGFLLGVKEPGVGEAGSSTWRGPTVVSGLKDMRTTGATFVVFRTKSALLRALNTPLPKFRGMHEISARHLPFSAGTILWDGFSYNDTQRIVLVFFGILCLLLLMIIWAVAFWGPYAYYVLQWTKVAGASQFMENYQGILQSSMLGLVISTGNQIIYQACATIAEKCRFRTRDSRDKMNVVLYTFAVSLNVVLDLELITYMAHGYQQDTGLDEEALVRNPSMQHALFVQLTSYIYPGTILLPFLFEPFAQGLFPFYIYKWLIRSRPDITRSQAERAFECMPFDLTRYGDLLVNMVLCSLIFFLTSVNIWWMFVQLIVSNLIICIWDHYRYLRYSTRTSFSTAEMDVCGQYLLVFPCAILAGAFAFKYQGGQSMVQDWERHTFFSVREEWIIVVAAMLSHIVVHSLILQFVIPMFVGKFETTPFTYEQAAKISSCAWFNANPVQTLRSIHYFCHEPPHIFDYAGKGHLHKVNREIHAYYEAPDFAPEKSLVQDIMAEVQDATERATTMIKHASERLTEDLSPRMGATFSWSPRRSRGWSPRLDTYEERRFSDITGRRRPEA